MDMKIAFAFVILFALSGLGQYTPMNIRSTMEPLIAIALLAVIGAGVYYLWRKNKRRRK